MVNECEALKLDNAMNGTNHKWERITSINISQILAIWPRSWLFGSHFMAQSQTKCLETRTFTFPELITNYKISHNVIFLTSSIGINNIAIPSSSVRHCFLIKNSRIQINFYCQYPPQVVPAV